MSDNSNLVAMGSQAHQERGGPVTVRILYDAVAIFLEEYGVWQSYTAA